MTPAAKEKFTVVVVVVVCFNRITDYSEDSSH